MLNSMKKESAQTVDMILPFITVDILNIGSKMHLFLQSEFIGDLNIQRSAFLQKPENILIVRK